MYTIIEHTLYSGCSPPMYLIIEHIICYVVYGAPQYTPL